jgi:hypothetical protein
MIKSDASSSTKTSFDLLDDFFLSIQWRGSKLDGGDNGGNGALDIRVLQRLNARRQRQGKKGEEGERPLNRFTTVKTRSMRPAKRGIGTQQFVSCHN